MAKFYTNLTNHESGTVESIQNNGGEYGIMIPRQQQSVFHCWISL